MHFFFDLMQQFHHLGVIFGLLLLDFLNIFLQILYLMNNFMLWILLVIVLLRFFLCNNKILILATYLLLSPFWYQVAVLWYNSSSLLIASLNREAVNSIKRLRNDWNEQIQHDNQNKDNFQEVNQPWSHKLYRSVYGIKLEISKTCSKWVNKSIKEIITCKSCLIFRLAIR